MKKTIVLSLLVHLGFGILLLYIGARFFIQGDPVFDISWTVNLVIATLAVIFGVRDVIHAYALTRLTIQTRNASGTANNGGNEIPEYGYRDKWERENL